MDRTVLYLVELQARSEAADGHRRLAVIQHDCLLDALHDDPLSAARLLTVSAARLLTVSRWWDVVKSFRASGRLMQ